MADPRFRALARCFLVRRHGESVGWDCSQQDLAKATGLSRRTVERVCEKHGYRTRPDERHYDRESIRNLSVDSFIAHNTQLRLNSY